MLLTKELVGNDVPEELKFLTQNIPALKKKIIVSKRDPNPREQKFVERWTAIRKEVRQIEKISPQKLP